MDIKKFTTSFFNHMKCELHWEDQILVVESIPKKFEKYVGKEGPYTFAFTKETKTSETELLEKGHYLLKAMSEFLNSKPQTTLVKLNLEIEPEPLLLKKFKFLNSEIQNVTPIKMYDYIFRFTFTSRFRYLNEKKQYTNSIYTYQNKIVNFDPEKHNPTQGKKSEIQITDLKDEYEIAKAHLKNLLKDKTEKISEYLTKKIEKEKARIEDHYAQQIKETEQSIEKNLSIVKKAEDQLPTSKEPEKVMNRLKRAKETLENISNSKEKEKLEKEKKFFINDEIHKHSLNLDNKLLNTTIIYYPEYLLKVLLKKDSGGGKRISLLYNPIDKTLQSIKCESCSEEINKVALCTENHISCMPCIEKCVFCEEGICKLCQKSFCDSCNRTSCHSCTQECTNCQKDFCKSHTRTSKFTNKPICTNCLKQCALCAKPLEEKYLSACPNCNRKVCNTCMKKSVGNGGIRVSCVKCTKGS